jgi:hypothetical protein
MKSLMSFLQEVLIDLGTWCCTSTTRDYQTISRRVEHEGLSFLTITLADFGKELETALDQGHVGPDQFTGFQRTGGLPRFLGGFLDQVFDRSTGRLLQEPSVVCIWAIRQLTLMWSKIYLECTPTRQKGAIDNYLECENDVRLHDTELPQELAEDFHRVSMLLWADVLSQVDGDIHRGEIVPKHGPGATADKLRGNAKWNQQEWTERLDEVFPHWEYLISGQREEDIASLSGVRIVEPGAERPVRVISVPKTQKTPRIIAVEPTCMQYVQQGLLASITGATKRSRFAKWLVGCQDQVPNQHLAEQGSRDRATATLDLSEASDRVSYQHVRLLLQNFPWLEAAVDSCRSRKADVPGHGEITLAKFASMGSALTFPMEEMVFSTIIFVAIESELRRRLTVEDVQSFRGSVRLFGDDIVVPTEFVNAVIRYLEAFGLKVNRSKSFWTGWFRESCGKEYYAGEDVSIVRLREFLPTRRTDVSEIVSTVSTMNQLYRAGLWRAAAHLQRVVERLNIPLPDVAESSPVLGRHSFLGFETQKLCKDLHRPLVKGYRVRSVIPVSKLDDRPALLKCLTQPPSDLPSDGVEHLERSGRPIAVSIKHGYGPSV